MINDSYLYTTRYGTVTDDTSIGMDRVHQQPVGRYFFVAPYPVTSACT